MRKLVIFMLVMLLLAPGTSALARDVEFVGGLTYDSIIISGASVITDSAGAQSEGTAYEAFSGAGFYFGGRYWFEKGYALGLGYDFCSAYIFNYGDEYYSASESVELSGPYVELVYPFNDMFRIYGGLALYNFQMKYRYTYEYAVRDVESAAVEEVTINQGSGPGYFVGFEFRAPLKGRYNLLGNLGFRAANITLDPYLGQPAAQQPIPAEEISVNGLRVGLAFSYDF